MRLKSIITSAFGCIFLSTFAQEPLSLDNYRERVVGYNQDVKRAAAGVVASDAQRKSIRTGFLPKIELQGDYTLNLRELEKGGLTPHIYKGVAVLTQNIWDGGYTNKQSQGAKLEKEIAIGGENLTIDNIVYQADLVYWTASANKDLYEQMVEYLRIVKNLYEVVNDRFNNGLISRTDLLMVETRLKEAELALVNAKKSNSLAQQSLNILMGEDPMALYQPSDTITMPMINPQQKSLGETLNNRSDFHIAELQVELAKAQKGQAMSKVNPKIYTGLTAGYTNNNVILKEMWVAAAFVGVRIPLLQWGDRKYTSRAAKANINIKELELQKSADQISLELSNAWTNLEESTSLVDIANQSVAIADRSLEINTFSYNEGRLTILDVLQSQLSWINARSNLIQHNMAHKMAISEYVRIIGGLEVVE